MRLFGGREPYAHWGQIAAFLDFQILPPFFFSKFRHSTSRISSLSLVDNNAAILNYFVNKHSIVTALPFPVWILKYFSHEILSLSLKMDWRLMILKWCVTTKSVLQIWWNPKKGADDLTTEADVLEGSENVLKNSSIWIWKLI